MKEIYQANISSIYDEIHCMHLSSIYHILVLFLPYCHQQKGEQFNNASVVKIHASFTLIYPIDIAPLHGNIHKFSTSKFINIKVIDSINFSPFVI